MGELTDPTLKQRKSSMASKGSYTKSEQYEASDNIPKMQSFYGLRFAIGILLSINFIVFWSIPIGVMGSIWKYGLKYPLQPFYNFFDQNKTIRKFAENYIYQKPIYADYFAISVLLLINVFVSSGVLFYWQLTTGSLPWWLIAAYYFSWVGLGGRMMGAAYALAHKEGHNQALYKKWIRKSFGNVFENLIGPLFGNVPWCFTTSHVFIHHKTDGGIGDTFYQWDLDRTSKHDFMLYLYRVLMHTSGISSLQYFHFYGQRAKRSMLMKGSALFYFVYPAVILAITRSPAFLFWYYIQPFLCMSSFLALLNFGFHGFIEFDGEGKHVKCVNSSCIVEGEDDYFGEDDHMAHHYAASVYFSDLPAHQKKQIAEWSEKKASVFKEISIVELSLLILFEAYDRLADKFVDYSGEMTKEEKIVMLRARAKRTETSYEKYQGYLRNPSPEVRRAILNIKT